MRNFKIILFIIIFNIVLLNVSGCQNNEQSEVEEKENIATPNEYQSNIQKEDAEAPNNQLVSDISYPDNEIISTFSTTIIDKSEGRMNNLRVTSDKINGIIIQSGSEFSFNRLVGKATKRNGYMKAVVLDKYGRRQWDYGGGVCQISSTLYNTANNAGMEIVERHSHKKDVGYLRQGEDAAITYGIGDFRFINNKTFPVKIISTVTDELVIVSFQKVK